ncbi:hypothetical protein [Rhodoglobus sp.]
MAPLVPGLLAFWVNGGTADAVVPLSTDAVSRVAAQRSATIGVSRSALLRCRATERALHV